MNSVIEFLGITVPLYGIFYYLGIFFAALTAFFLSRKKIPAYDLVCSSVYSVLGGVAGAKLLFLAVSFPEIIALNIPITALIKGGFVFYGGLFGGMAGLLFYCRKFRLPFWDYASLYSVVLPLGHAFGRVGCHFAGCCYGGPYDGPFSVCYKESMGATPLGVPLFPVQLLESVLLLILFLILLFVYQRQKGGEKQIAAGLYGVLYALLRFSLEFLRADDERGAFWIFSTSQWISLFLFLFGLFILFFLGKKTKYRT
ncbi:MAG: prolipoprotein diacylglyceryl transferase [Clostridia bacterium]|nr:prolipoprotein diacylglyceryl transferase [Clostridia bacterium]